MKSHTSTGGSVLFEFACDKDSNLGTIGPEHRVRVIRLCKEDIDPECPESIEQLIEQVRGLPGCSIYCPIECTPWLQWQRLNRAKHPRFISRIKKEQEDSENLFKQFIRVVSVWLHNSGECS